MSHIFLGVYCDGAGSSALNQDKPTIRHATTFGEKCGGPLSTKGIKEVC